MATKADSKSKVKDVEVTIPVERQKAAQAAGVFELEELPIGLTGITDEADPKPAPLKLAAAVRVGKTAKQDKGLKLVRTLAGIAKIKPGQTIVNYGKSEQKWAKDYDRRHGGKADPIHLLSFARQIIGLDDEGRLRICLMGHAGSKWGPCVPLWVVREDVILTVQPNDVLLRYNDLEIDG